MVSRRDATGCIDAIGEVSDVTWAPPQAHGGPPAKIAEIVRHSRKLRRTRNSHITNCNTRPFCKCTRNPHITDCNTRPFLFFVIQRTFHITENENRKQSTDSCQDLFSVKSGSLKSICKSWIRILQKPDLYSVLYTHTHTHVLTLEEVLFVRRCYTWTLRGPEVAPKLLAAKRLYHGSVPPQRKSMARR